MIIDIKDYKIIKEVEIKQVIIDIISIDFDNKIAIFKVFFSNDIFNNDDSNKYVEIKGQEYEQWGNDDSYIFDLILQKLNLTKNNI